MAKRSLSNRPRPRGFSYVEILLSVALLAVLLVPALQALQSGVAGGQNPALAVRQLALRDRMEQVLARPFADLYARTYPDNLTSANALLSDPADAPDRRVVVLYRYNIVYDPVKSTFTGAWDGGDTGLVFVSVFYEAEGSANGLNTLVGRWW